MAEAELEQWSADGDRNSEYISLDSEYEGNVPSNTLAVSVAGLFTFFMSTAPTATNGNAFAVSLPSAYNKSAALNEFVAITNRAKAGTVPKLLDAATKAYVKIADARDAEVRDEGSDHSDTADTEQDAMYFQTAPNDPQEVARKEADAKLRTMRALYANKTALPTATMERLLKDLAEVQRMPHHGWSATPLNDDLATWEVKLFDFDKDTPLDKDMKQLQKQTGETSVVLHMKFPAAYPNKPPFVRVIRPRFMMRTGRVTIGGSLCTELLVSEGWQPVFAIESIIETIREQITSSEAGARVDMSRTDPYTEAEAIEAFNRVAMQHGWSVM